MPGINNSSWSVSLTCADFFVVIFAFVYIYIRIYIYTKLSNVSLLCFLFALVSHLRVLFLLSNHACTPFSHWRNLDSLYVKWMYSVEMLRLKYSSVIWVPLWLFISCRAELNHWERVTHICVGNLNIIGSDNGLSPGRRQANYLNQCCNVVNWALGTNFSEILIEIYIFSFKKMHLKMPSGKWRPFWLGLNVLIVGSIKLYLHFLHFFHLSTLRWHI